MAHRFILVFALMAMLFAVVAPEAHAYRDPETGTFITRDPLGFVDGPNMYAYVRQNPWSAFDPLGLKTATEYGEEIENSRSKMAEVRTEAREIWDSVKGERSDLTPTQSARLQDLETTYHVEEARIRINDRKLNILLNSAIHHNASVGAIDPIDLLSIDDEVHTDIVDAYRRHARDNGVKDIATEGGFMALGGGLAGLGKLKHVLKTRSNSKAPQLASQLEANAQRQLAQLQSEAGSRSHFVSRHGAQTTLEQQYTRATTGLTPDGFAGRAVDSSRFLSHRAQLTAAQKAMQLHRQTGNRVVNFEMGGIIGEGFARGGGDLIRTTNVRAVIRNGRLHTMFPTLSPLP